MGGVGLNKTFNVLRIARSVWMQLLVDHGKLPLKGTVTLRPNSCVARFCRNLMGQYFLAVLYVLQSLGLACLLKCDWSTSH